jgi:hypothetical protein
MGFFFGQAERRFLQDRRPGKVQVLLEMADTIVARDRDLSGVGLFLPKDESEESGFAVAVSSHQPETLAGVHLQVDVREQLASEIGLRKLVDLNHNGFFQ